MARTTWIFAALLLMAALVCAQPPTPPGAVHAVVQLIDGTPVAGARVQLAGHAPIRPHQMPRPFFAGMTGLDGVVAFANVPEGPYTISANMPRMGMAAARLEVVSLQTTNVTLIMQRHDSTFHPRDSLTVVELSGTAIVITDSLHPRRVGYFLDVDEDAVPDYRLAFGPPWYNPPSGAVRPENGDEITVVGGLLTYTDPPVVVVFAIDSMFWRDPRHGHGGHPGGDHQGRGCDPDSIIAVELNGMAMVRTADGWHGERTVYAIDVNGDQTPDYALDFGGPDYNPDNGAVRPANGDAITIVGGQIFCANEPLLPIVIVYEINGLLWRVPGDTVGLGAVALSVGEPVYIGEPVSHLMARNYPNPFNPVTTISYSVPVSGSVQLKVYDIAGREVASLVNAHQEAGSYAVAWDGSAQASGIYFYRLSVGNLSVTSRMVLMK